MLNNKKLTNVMHGENFLRKVNNIKGNWSKVKEDLYIVGHSESGHNHVLENPNKTIKTLEKDNKRYILIEEVSKLFHQKTFDIHETIAVEPGIYEITHKTEYDPFNEVIRQVWD